MPHRLISKRRKELGITQLQLSRRLGYATPQFVSIMERGLAPIPLQAVPQLAKHLRLSESTLERLVLNNAVERMKKRAAK
jgi:transcriptional regulator with XRE-family HTH domain